LHEVPEEGRDQGRQADYFEEWTSCDAGFLSDLWDQGVPHREAVIWIAVVL
jgi:hypothetical protein